MDQPRDERGQAITQGSAAMLRWRLKSGPGLDDQVMNQVPKSAGPWVATLLRTVFHASVRAQMASVIAALDEKFPKAAEHLEAAREDLLAFAPTRGRSGGRSGPTTHKRG